MQSFINTLVGILSLEQKRGYADVAVVGGFAKFTKFIKSNGTSDNIQAEDIARLIRVFEQYRSLPIDARKRMADACLAWLKDDPIQNRLVLPDIEPEKEPAEIENVERPESPAPEPEIKVSPVQDPALYGEIKSIRGIGNRNSTLFIKLGINTIYDLLRYFPRRYQDFSHLKTINRLEYGDELSVIGTIMHDLYTRSSKRGNLKITEAVLGDSTGTIKLTWFNQPYLSTQLGKGTSIVVSGKVDMYLGRLVMNSPDWEPLNSQQLHTNRIVPMYPLTAGLSQRVLRKIIHQNLPFWTKRVKEYLPQEVLENEQLPDITASLNQIHFPDTTESLDITRKRFAFEELFFLQLGVILQKSTWTNRPADKYPLSEAILQASQAQLPYKLTSDQRSAINDIMQDLQSGKPMNRLLQGDVGSGKTIVAKFAIQAVIQHNAQAAVMAPTSILAEQHFRTLSEQLVKDGAIEPDEMALLIGSTPASQRKDIYENLANGTLKVIVGTHALLEDPVEFNNLQLAVIDEQHRFGVEQRAILQEKGHNPHLLVMTATPIPRSLALTVYGDLDVTTITEMPPGRQPVETRLIPPALRKDAYKLIRGEIAKGFQAFIVYPLVETDDEDEDYRAAVNEYKRIQEKVFPDLKIGLMHGKLKPSEKDDVMLAFRNGDYDILVSTTVIEVGVDIPRATVVLIEGANRFGLAQLHQIRGRVGRNSDQSYCLLIPEKVSALENERLTAMTNTNDGFKLAEIDLNQRGPGEFLGTRQSGYLGLRFSSITDTHLIEKCRKYAQTIYKNDATLSLPENQLLKEQLKIFWPGIKFNINN